VAFRRSLELEPRFHEALYNLGTLCLEDHELETAVELLEKAVAIDSDMSRPTTTSARRTSWPACRSWPGRAFEEALERDPEKPGRPVQPSACWPTRAAKARQKRSTERGCGRRARVRADGRRVVTMAGLISSGRLQRGLMVGLAVTLAAALGSADEIDDRVDALNELLKGCRQWSPSVGRNRSW